MIKSGDSKEIRLKEFSYALERMESLKSGNELTNKIVETQGTRIYSKGDSVPEIESINTFLTTISFAVEDLFNNTYEVLNNSLEQYIASDEAIGKLWEQIQNDNDEKDSSDPFKDVVTNFQSGVDANYFGMDMEITRVGDTYICENITTDVEKVTKMVDAYNAQAEPKQQVSIDDLEDYARGAGDKNQREDDEDYKALCNRVKEYMKYILEN